jgi:hypothetical protein
MRPAALALLTILAGGLAGIAPASADAVISLNNVQFADGGTASGDFSLNVLNYLSGESIVTTVGTTGSPLFPGVSYDPAFQTLHNPTDLTVAFQSDAYTWNLVLDFVTVMTGATAGIDELVPGAGTPGNYTGSYEECTLSFCGGLSYQAARFITSGSAQVPEPASLTILGFAAMASFAARRLPRRQA